MVGWGLGGKGQGFVFGCLKGNTEASGKASTVGRCFISDFCYDFEHISCRMYRNCLLRFS